MENPTSISTESVSARPISWYARPAIDQFLASADDERARLVAVIEDAHDRLARARATTGIRQTMVVMLLDSQRELTELRRQAEQRAAEILAAADDEVLGILGRVPGGPGAGTDGEVPSSNGPQPPRDLGSTDVIDLVEDEAPPDEFLEFLRGALVDDEPLGPRPEPGSR